jgi:hypothetical protein
MDTLGAKLADFEASSEQHMSGVEFSLAMLNMYNKALKAYPTDECAIFANFLPEYIENNVRGDRLIKLGNTPKDRKVGYILLVCQRALTANQYFSDLVHSRNRKAEDEGEDDNKYNHAQCDVYTHTIYRIPHSSHSRSYWRGIPDLFPRGAGPTYRPRYHRGCSLEHGPVAG